MYELFAVLFFFVFTVLVMAVMRHNDFNDDWYSVFSITCAMCIGAVTALVWPISLCFVGLVGLAFCVHKLIAVYHERKYRSKHND